MSSHDLGEDWTKILISRIEDLSDAVYDAGLEATQMSADALSGSLAFAQNRGIIYGSGYIGGTVALTGPLSCDKVTFGLGLDVRPGTWHWMNEVHTGDIGVFHPGDEHDSRYAPGTLYATLSIDADQLQEEAAREELVLDRKTLGGTGFHSRRLPDALISRLRRQFEQIHRGLPVGRSVDVGETMLRAAINHFGRPPFYYCRRAGYNIHARIVGRARSYIRDHLDESISVDAVAAAAFTSRRTLFRAFAEMLDDTPHTYVRRLRLHRIRHDLASEAEKARTIALIANEWGMGDLGRMAGWYRELFGELPSKTVARAHGSADGPESKGP
ncbi:AraC family transcriptional regulator [Mesorhizobium sp.]|uniref:AraC family transcriptional regulator n=1 Tax=Mesorhizobium sp. TaxID=1871066 RepID=UPI000FE8261E|nr:AraC family transcriptional regulator [Mesorhizobium sp.]RWP50302.1 MAG: AraC family transcriptional regulator [Mesorhizobium sp.]